MHLIIQGGDVATTDLKQIAKLAGASRIERITGEAFRLCDAKPADGIPALCEQARLDCAFVPEDRRLADFRLLVMDMDSTLITIETIDELADLMGIKSEVATITAQAMRGEIEYDESLRRRLALLKGEDENALVRVYEERLKLSPGAERLLAEAKRHGIRTLLVSGGFTQITDRLKTRLGLDYTYSNVLAIENGKLTGEVDGRIVNADAKRDELHSRARRTGTQPRTDHRGGRRRQRPQVSRRVRRQRRLPRQAGGARAGHVRDQLRRARRRGESIRLNRKGFRG